MQIINHPYIAGVCAAMLLTGFALPLSAQDFKNAERYAEWNIAPLVGSLEVIPKFDDSGNAFCYSFSRDTLTSYYYVCPGDKRHKEIFTNYTLCGKIEKLSGVSLDPKKLKPENLRFAENGKELYFNVDTLLFAFDVGRSRLKKRAPNERHDEPAHGEDHVPLRGTISPDRRYSAFIEEHNLYFASRDTVMQLTLDGETDYSFGGARDNYDDISLISSVRWFPDSKHFYIVRPDFRGVNKWTRLNRYDMKSKPEEIVFSMPGDRRVPRYELYLFDTLTESLREVAVGKWKDQKLQLVESDDELFIIREKRSCDELEVCRLDRSAGEVEVLFGEKCEPYFEPVHKKLYVFNGGKDLVWRSERSGYAHLYHYDQNGQQLNAITSGEWSVGDVVRFDTHTREVYFYAFGQTDGECPYFAKLNKASIDGGGVKCLTPEMATHNVTFSPNGKYFIDHYSRADLEPVNLVRDTDGRVALTLSSPDLSRLYAYGWRMPEQIEVMAADRITVLYGHMWKPYNMEEGRKYPVISNVYPGPTSDDVQLTFDPSFVTNDALAQLGFIVVNFGHRGGFPLRNLRYRTYGYGNLRDFAIEDDKYGLEQLARQHAFIDIGRVGIMGHSAGGQMAFTAMCTYPDFYKAGVASAGPHILSEYNRWWGETFHGVKEKTNANGNIVFECDISDNLELVNKLKGALLLVSGDNETNVPINQTLSLADALVAARKDFDMWLLPRQGHQYMAKYRDFYQKLVWAHFCRNL